VADLARATHRRTVTYGIADGGAGEGADVRASALRQDGSATAFQLHLPDREGPVAMRLALPGRHNVLNALAACAIGWQLGVEADAMQRALARFQGVGRRFQLRGSLALADGGEALLVDDYGHHPREIAAVFAAARAGWPQRRLAVAFQPHRYSRTRDLLDDFANVLAEADVLVLTDVYPAGEAPIANADGRALARAVRARGKVDPVLVEHPRDLPAALAPLLADGDLLLLLGAGDIGATASDLAQAGRLDPSGGT
jgi:UDP-N-acetylmuramate--alanine ligase